MTANSKHEPVIQVTPEPKLDEAHIAQLGAIGRAMVTMQRAVNSREEFLVDKLLSGQMRKEAAMCKRFDAEEMQTSQRGLDERFSAGEASVEKICNAYNQFKQMQWQYEHICKDGGGIYSEPQPGLSMACSMPKRSASRIPQ